MLSITFAVYSEMLNHCRDALPLEACGYLAAREDTIVRLFRMTNTDLSREHYSMDPAEQFQAIKTMRREGLTLAAVYHSHPETPARPSAEDIKLAFDPSVVYLIVSLLPGAEEVKAYTIRTGQVERKKLVVLRQATVASRAGYQNHEQESPHGK